MTRVPSFWLFKSEPDVYSIERLKQEQRTEWSGVRNYQARNFMREMRLGDVGFFYHSNAKPTGIAGICRVCREAYPDHSARDPMSEYFDRRATTEQSIWEMVDVEFVKNFPRVITLNELRAIPELADMNLLRKGQRLSVLPVQPHQWARINAIQS